MKRVWFWHFLLMLLSLSAGQSIHADGLSALARACQQGATNFTQKMRETLVQHFPELAPFEVRAIEQIESGASPRKFYRVHWKNQGPQNTQSSVLMLFPQSLEKLENYTFLPLSNDLDRKGVPISRVLLAHQDQSFVENALLVEDLGSQQLKTAAVGEKTEALYRKVILTVTDKIHRLKESDFDPQLIQRPFDFEYYKWEQDYFVDHFLKLHSKLDNKTIEDIVPLENLNSLAKSLSLFPRHMLHRDFQCENVMIKKGEVFFVDFQGLRGGRPEYDLGSLIYDPYQMMSRELQDQLVHESYLRLKKLNLIPEKIKSETEWRQQLFYPATAQRLMQALGAYGRLGNIDVTRRYLKHIPRARENLITVLEKGKLFPKLRSVLKMQRNRELTNHAP